MDKQLIEDLVKIVEYVNDVNVDFAVETGETIPYMTNERFQEVLTEVRSLAIAAKFGRGV